MKPYTFLRRSVLPLSTLILTAGLYSCKKQDVSGDPAPAAATNDTRISTDVLQKIRQLGFSTENAKKTAEGYIVEGDILLHEEQLDDVPVRNSMIFGQEEHYRTNYVVNKTAYPVIKVALNNSSSVHQAVFSAAVDSAIKRYNMQWLDIRFQRVTTGAHITVQAYREVSNTLGYAGFPTYTGAPYSRISMNTYWYKTSTATSNVNYIASVIAHEIGHCIGFRHTDYMNRAYSCGGTAVNEGTAGVGAVHIPNTQTGPAWNSWMLACIGDQVNRPFTGNDRVALLHIY